MIANITYGCNAAAAINYNENKVEEGVAVRLGVVNLDESANGFEIASSLEGFGASANVEDYTFHVSLNLPPEEEELSDDRFMELANGYMKLMGYDSNPYVVYRHNDRGHQHIHIVSTRNSEDGPLINSRYEFYKSQEVTTSLERQFGLTVVDKTIKKDRELTSLAVDKEGLLMDKEGEVGVKSIIAKATGEVKNRVKFTNFTEYKKVLSSYDIEAKTVNLKDGKTGLVYILKENNVSLHPIKASSLYHNAKYDNILSIAERNAKKAETGKKAKVNDLIKKIDEAVNTYELKDIHDFKIKLAAKGVTTLFDKYKDGRIYGIGFIDVNGYIHKGSDLGKAYSFNALNKRITAAEITLTQGQAEKLVSDAYYASYRQHFDLVGSQSKFITEILSQEHLFTDIAVSNPGLWGKLKEPQKEQINRIISKLIQEKNKVVPELERKERINEKYNAELVKSFDKVVEVLSQKHGKEVKPYQVLKQAILDGEITGGTQFAKPGMMQKELSKKAYDLYQIYQTYKRGYFTGVDQYANREEKNKRKQRVEAEKELLRNFKQDIGSIVEKDNIKSKYDHNGKGIVFEFAKHEEKRMYGQLTNKVMKEELDSGFISSVFPISLGQDVEGFAQGINGLEEYKAIAVQYFTDKFARDGLTVSHMEDTLYDLIDAKAVSMTTGYALQEVFAQLKESFDPDLQIHENLLAMFVKAEVTFEEVYNRADFIKVKECLARLDITAGSLYRVFEEKLKNDAANATFDDLFHQYYKEAYKTNKLEDPTYNYSTHYAKMVDTYGSYSENIISLAISKLDNHGIHLTKNEKDKKKGKYEFKILRTQAMFEVKEKFIEFVKDYKAGDTIIQGLGFGAKLNYISRHLNDITKEFIENPEVINLVKSFNTEDFEHEIKNEHLTGAFNGLRYEQNYNDRLQGFLEEKDYLNTYINRTQVFGEIRQSISDDYVNQNKINAGHYPLQRWTEQQGGLLVSKGVPLRITVTIPNYSATKNYVKDRVIESFEKRQERFLYFKAVNSVFSKEISERLKTQWDGSKEQYGRSYSLFLGDVVANVDTLLKDVMKAGISTLAEMEINLTPEEIEEKTLYFENQIRQRQARFDVNQKFTEFLKDYKGQEKEPFGLKLNTLSSHSEQIVELFLSDPQVNKLIRSFDTDSFKYNSNPKDLKDRFNELRYDTNFSEKLANIAKEMDGYINVFNDIDKVFRSIKQQISVEHIALESAEGRSEDDITNNYVKEEYIDSLEEHQKPHILYKAIAEQLNTKMSAMLKDQWGKTKKRYDNKYSLFMEAVVADKHIYLKEALSPQGGTKSDLIEQLYTNLKCQVDRKVIEENLDMAAERNYTSKVNLIPILVVKEALKEPFNKLYKEQFSQHKRQYKNQVDFLDAIIEDPALIRNAIKKDSTFLKLVESVEHKYSTTFTKEELNDIIDEYVQQQAEYNKEYLQSHKIGLADLLGGAGAGGPKNNGSARNLAKKKKKNKDNDLEI